MRRILLTAGLATALAAPLFAAPDSAEASCRDRKVTGTVLGGVGGALLGNAISGGGGGAVLGGVGGAVVGHEIGRSGCRRAYRPAAYRERPRAYRSSARRYERRYEAPRPTTYVYYDQYGQPISSGPAPGSTAFTQARYVDAGRSACRMEVRSYYDDRGLLAQRQVEVCR